MTFLIVFWGIGHFLPVAADDMTAAEGVHKANLLLLLIVVAVNVFGMQDDKMLLHLVLLIPDIDIPVIFLNCRLGLIYLLEVFESVKHHLLGYLKRFLGLDWLLLGHLFQIFWREDCDRARNLATRLIKWVFWKVLRFIYFIFEINADTGVTFYGVFQFVLFFLSTVVWTFRIVRSSLKE